MMTEHSHYSTNLSTNRMRHIASSTKNSYHKTTFIKNSNFLPIYQILKKIAGPSVATFYLDCDNKEADLQKRYRTLLAKSISIEDRFRKVQHNLTLYKNQEEMNQTFQTFQEVKEKTVYLQPSQEEQDEEEKIQKEYQILLKLEQTNQSRAEQLKRLSKKIEKERYYLFQSTFTDLAHNFDYHSPYYIIQNHKKIYNYPKKNIDTKYKLSKYNHLEVPYKKGITSDLNIQKTIRNSTILTPNEIFDDDDDDENAEILFNQKQQRIEKLQSTLSVIKSFKKKYKVAQKQRDEAAKTYNFLIEKKNRFLFQSFSEPYSQSQIENAKISQIYNTNKVIRSKIRQILIKEKLLLTKKDNLQKMLEELEQESQKVIEKEKNVILLEQKILDVRKKFDDTVLKSQKELDFFDFYSSLKSTSGLPLDSQYTDEFQKIIKNNLE